MGQQFILRYHGSGAAPREDIARVRAAPETSVLDESPRMLLVHGSPESLSRVVGELASWTLSPVTSVPLPDPRPTIQRRG